MGAKIHPLTGTPKNGKRRVDLLDVLSRRRRVFGEYDAAQTSDDYKNYWASADQYDADSSHTRAVREKLVQRSRYEVGNNGYADGIAQTYATDLVGTGPKLRMQSGSPGFNQLVETEWFRWSSEIQLRRKLWCQAHAKHVDGEGFGVARTNMALRHPVKLDYVLYETEQFQTPLLPFQERGYIDGVKFDQFGNVEYYDLLREHPGSTNGFSGFAGFTQEPERIPARYVMHWFLMRRPGQHRGIPESTSTLNVGASSRRWREATLAAAETSADFSMLLKTQMAPEETDLVEPMTATDIKKRMMVALPMGWDAYQMKSEHPNATYEAFHKSQINELARPRSMPYNKAACDSSSYNYASGRLDHQTYYGALDVDRADGADLVLTPLFLLWFDEAIRVFEWLGGAPEAVGPGARSHSWDWPKHRVADIQAEAKASEIKLRTGQTTLSRMYSDAGEDFEDELLVMARDYGVTPDEMRAILRQTLFGVTPEQPQTEADEDDDEQT